MELLACYFPTKRVAAAGQGTQVVLEVTGTTNMNTTIYLFI